MRRRRLALAAAVAMILVFVGSLVFKKVIERPAGPDEPHIEASSVSPWQGHECPAALVKALAALSKGHEAECGYLRVPESPNSGRQIELMVVRLRRPNSLTRTPLLVLSGGPGDAFIPHLSRRLPYILPLAPDRELIFVDQRGTGLSRPRLECPINQQGRVDLPRCFRAWNADLDLGAFTTAHSVSDLKKLLEEFQIPRVVLYGLSYGTRLALDFASGFESRVEALILDSPVSASADLLAQVGINAEVALSDLLDECQEQRACAAAFPARMNDLVELVATLRRAPPSGRPSGREFLINLSQLMYSPGALQYIPFLLEEARQGEFEDYFHFVGAFAGRSFALGAHLSVQCSEHLSFTTMARIEDADAAMHPALVEALSARSYMDSCSIWKVPSSSRSREETRISVPALILNGRYDRATPLSYAKSIGASLSNSKLVVLGNVGHGVAFTSCGASVVRRFVAGLGEARETQEPDCIQQERKIDFALEAPERERMRRLIDELHYRL